MIDCRARRRGATREDTFGAAATQLEMRRRPQIAAAANRAAQVADSLLPKVASLQVNPELASAVLRNVTSDSASIGGAGPRVAEQAVMAVETFVPVARKSGKQLAQEPVVTSALQKLSQVRVKPEEYDREQFEQFATQMRAIHSFLTQ